MTLFFLLRISGEEETKLTKTYKPNHDTLAQIKLKPKANDHRDYEEKKELKKQKKLTRKIVFDQEKFSQTI